MAAEEIHTFKSSGKFLITAEYLILKGAKGLALPLKYGQILSVKQNGSAFITWSSHVFNNTWFEAVFHVKDLSILSSNNDDVANSLQKVFRESRNLNPDFLHIGVEATITADFNLAWGLGSSSTLINNIASWAQVDPYLLLEKTFGGSGYDIACAGAKGPITYQLQEESRIVEDVSFHPPFHKNIFFVYLGKKMNSRTGMSYFKEKAEYNDRALQEVSAITEKLIACKDLEQFEGLLNMHEALLSAILKMPTIQESLFSNYPHTIKSMGAWGGDFVLVSGESEEQVRKYFISKGLEIIIPYKDIVLS